MKNGSIKMWTRHVVLSILMLAGLVPIGGCSGVVERHWVEEVALDDGSLVVVERHVKFKESNSLAGDAYSAAELESTLSFSGDLAIRPIWSAPFQPLLLYLDASSHEWVIVATPGSCDVWAGHGSPAPPYWEFRLRGDKWVQSGLSAASIGRRTNLFFNYDPPMPSQKLTREMKEHVIATNDFSKRYLTIADMKINCTPRD